MDAELAADFHCREGWSRLGERWRGVRLRTLLAFAGAAWDCFLSVNSVDRIEVTRQRQRATAATIALARLGRSSLPDV
jgi:DMSO/TMAO reductase YedYZ molybdopterin-dependent catalytic subunit